MHFISHSVFFIVLIRNIALIYSALTVFFTKCGLRSTFKVR